MNEVFQPARLQSYSEGPRGVRFGKKLNMVGATANCPSLRFCLRSHCCSHYVTALCEVSSDIYPIHIRHDLPPPFVFLYKRVRVPSLLASTLVGDTPFALPTISRLSYLLAHASPDLVHL